MLTATSSKEAAAQVLSISQAAVINYRRGERREFVAQHHNRAIYNPSLAEAVEGHL
jgi:predicted transcriptional regulator